MLGILSTTRLQSRKWEKKPWKKGLKDSYTAISCQNFKDIFYECTKNEVFKDSRKIYFYDKIYTSYGKPKLGASLE